MPVKNTQFLYRKSLSDRTRKFPRLPPPELQLSTTTLTLSVFNADII
ncbi:MAG: hypothetical protein V7K62_27625 [Nostoc sp.]